MHICQNLISTLPLEFDEAGDLLEGNRDATTISIEDDVKPQKQRNAAEFPQDGYEEGTDDKEEVRKRPVLTENKYISLLLNGF